MKTFGLFMFMWLCIMLSTFAIFKGASDREITLFTLSTLIAYIFYKLIKEESE